MIRAMCMILQILGFAKAVYCVGRAAQNKKTGTMITGIVLATFYMQSFRLILG